MAKVTTPVLVGVNTYSVDIKALKPSFKSADGLLIATTVTIFAKDSFGAESKVTTFDVAVNRPPVVGYDLPDVILYRGANPDDT